MWIADTTASDGIAIVAFATVLFLILFGIVSLAKWIFRLISGRPNPARMETVVVVLERKEFEDDEGDEEVNGDIRNFALYLHSKLAKEKAGYYSETNQEDYELFLCFEGPDANRIWDLLNAEIEAHSPAKPQRAILEHAKNGGGTRVVEPIAWRPCQKLDFQPLPEVGIPEKWLSLSGYGRLLSILGFSGLIGWRVIRMSLGQTENEFMNTGIGMLLAYLVGALLVSGLSLFLICTIRFRAISKTSGFPNPCADSPTSSALMYVLLIVFALFGLILFVI